MPRQARAPWVDVLSFIPFLVLLFPASLVLGQTLRTAQEHADRGSQLAQAGHLSAAEAELQQAVTLAPDDPSYLAELGGILGLEHKLEQANPHFEKALKIDPNNLTIRRNLAANEWQMGRLQEAKHN